MTSALPFVTVGQLAQLAGCAPPEVTGLFARGRLDRQACPIVAGRRLIPAELVPDLVRQIQERPRRWRRG